MKILTKVIYFWGICDLIFILIYLLSCISNKDIPLYSEILYLSKVFKSPTPSLFIWAGTSLFLLQLSIFFTAYLLLKQHKAAAIICYFQFPIRITIAYSSLPFIRSDMELYENHDLLFYYVIVIELIKLITIITWHRGKLKDI